MAILAGWQRGQTMMNINGAKETRAPIRYGNSAAIVTPTAAATVALPVDPQGNAYAAYYILSAGNIWWCWTTGTGNATVGGANCYLQGSGSNIIAPPAGATSISAIFDGSSTAGSLCIIGVY